MPLHLLVESKFYINQEAKKLPAIIKRQKKENFNETRNKVFVSYSREDKSCLDDIKLHFKPFLKQIDFWDDNRIEPGQKWKEEIRKAIKETKVAILLVSANFLASDFISTDELPPLLEAAENEGAVILIVVLRPCLFKENEELSQYQTMNPPSKPVSKMDDNEKDDLYVNLVRQTKKLLIEK